MNKAHSEWMHDHSFHSNHEHSKKRTLWVLWLTAVTMVAEITAGMAYGSMALLADGWHMATHVAAFAITLFAYRYAEKHRNNPEFTFGTGKVSVLGGFASAVALAVVAFMMAAESLQRIFNPHDIQFDQAIWVAVLGLLVNLVSAVLLHDDHHHDHDHAHDHAHHHHHDHNLKAAYFHVLADALTSVLAIVALLAGKYYNQVWLDSLMGVVGAIIISKWALGLIRQTSGILLDRNLHGELESRILETLKSEDFDIIDFHIWSPAAGRTAVILSGVTHKKYSSDFFRTRLENVKGIDHLTLEVIYCENGCLQG